MVEPIVINIVLFGMRCFPPFLCGDQIVACEILQNSNKISGLQNCQYTAQLHNYHECLFEISFFILEPVIWKKKSETPLSSIEPSKKKVIWARTINKVTND